MGGGLLTWPGGTTPYPWDRLEKEPEDEYSLMRLYIDLGPTRSFTSLAETCGKDEETLRTVARVNRWDLRVQRYEDYLTSTTSQYLDQLIAAQNKESERLANTLLVDQLGKLAVQIHNERDSVEPDVLIRRAQQLSGIKKELRAREKKGSAQEGGKTFHFHLTPQRKEEQGETIDVEYTEAPLDH